MTPTETFTVPCDACGRPVTIRSVSEFHNAGGFRGYSYTVHCDCGSYCHHDGADGGFIPESMKQAAGVRHRAFAVRVTVDFQRRDLPASFIKTLLKDSRVYIPEMLDDAWIVYRLPDRRTVSYSPDADIYALRDRETVRQFSSVADLAAHLDDGSRPSSAG